MQANSAARRAPDAEASRLYAEYHDKILRYCAGQLRSREEAEDAVQNTFMRVVTALRKGVVPEFEGPWLYKIAHNVCLSKRLGSSRRARVETPADLDTLGERAAAYTPDADELFGLGDALADMPANLRRPLLMREWQGMSYMEIAEALGVSHSAVETLIFRARRHLAQALTDSVKKTGRAVASIFNLRWLFNMLKGLGGGIGSAGLAAGTAGLVVVAVGGGVALDLATQHASASRRTAAAIGAAAAGTQTAALRSRQGTPDAAARGHAGGAAGTAATGGRERAGAGPGTRGTQPGSTAGTPAGGSGGAGGPGAPSAGSSSSPAGSSRSAPSKTAGSSPSGASGAGGSAQRPPKPGSSPSPPAGQAPSVPPISVPSVPPVPPLAPPSVSPPPVPPLPPLPPPPVITTPGSLVAEAAGPLGAVVAYTVTAKDAAGNALGVTCTPASGVTFALGHTTVSCSSTDRDGSTSRASFDVLVRDTTAPVLTVPADMKLQTTLTSGLKVTFTATATDLVDATPKVTCDPASGSIFLIQTTTVTCSATDDAGNSSSKSFHVTVTLAPPPLP